MESYDITSDIAAIATALGGALAIIRCSGPKCIKKMATIFSRPKALLSAAGGSIVYGWILANDGAKVDQVLLSVFRAPRSYTGGDMVEISCHGGLSTTNAVMKALLENGFRLAKNGEFTLRAFCAKKIDLTKAESVAELIASKTDTARKNALNRLSGALYKTLDAIKKSLIDCVSSIEVAVEYPEDTSVALDTKYNAAKRDKMIAAQKSLKILLDGWAAQRLYQTGVKIAILGKTNAGKSSLFNALLKEERAIVSDIAGTTRDYIDALLDIAGIPCQIFDTAGLRDNDANKDCARDIIEEKGIERSVLLSKEVDLVLYVIDGAAGDDDVDKSFLNRCTTPVIAIFNKCDKTAARYSNGVNISVKDGSGFNALIKAIKQKLYSIEGVATPQAESKTCDNSMTGHNGERLDYLQNDDDRFNNTTKCRNKKENYSKGSGECFNDTMIADVARSSDGTLGTERQKILITQALESLDHAIAAGDDYLDCIIEDLNDAIMTLGEITGEVTTGDILENIFSKFCVGK